MTKKKIRALVRQKLKRAVRIGRNPLRPRQWIVEIMGDYSKPSPWTSPQTGRGLTLAAAYQHLNIS